MNAWTASCARSASRRVCSFDIVCLSISLGFYSTPCSMSRSPTSDQAELEFLAYEGHGGPLADDRSMSVIGVLLPVAL
jgi:hypothetical protein